MKKYVSVLCVLISFLLTGCTTFEFDNEGELDFGYSQIRNQAYVAKYDWDGTEEGMHFTIPDTYNGYAVTSLGGYYGSGVPTPFGVLFPESYDITKTTTIEPEEYPEYYTNGYEIIPLIFYVTLGKNIKEARNVDFYYHMRENEDLSVTLYQVFYYFDVVSENPYIYTVDGRVYLTETDELLEGLIYMDE